ADLWINNREVKGISYFGRMCSDDGTSSSVVEDMGDYYCIYTTARALAVSMSATIDGVYNNCSSEDFYLMSNQFSNITDSSVLNPWKLSNCTIESIVMFISSLENTSSSRHACLLNTTVTHVSDVSSRLLGQEIYPDKQCQLKYGKTSYDCQVVQVGLTTYYAFHQFSSKPAHKNLFTDVLKYDVDVIIIMIERQRSMTDRYRPTCLAEFPENHSSRIELGIETFIVID
uniref:Uncharacterized protein n=1 Tax=Biomphalaria glabrata TaxID=6526 RepID=A0A2C9M8R9_BIOGL